MPCIGLSQSAPGCAVILSKRWFRAGETFRGASWQELVRANLDFMSVWVRSVQSAFSREMRLVGSQLRVAIGFAKGWHVCIHSARFESPCQNQRQLPG
jgi:hypothetical protein